MSTGTSRTTPSGATRSDVTPSSGTTTTPSRPGSATGAAGTSPPTRPWALVAMREIQVKLTDRNFLVSTGFTLVLLIGLMAGQAWLGGGSAAYTVAVTDDAGSTVVQDAGDALQAADEEATLTATQVSDRAAGERAVTEQDADALLTQVDGQWELSSDGEPSRTLQQALADTVRTDALTRNAEAAGTSVEALEEGTELATANLSEEDSGAAGVNFFVGLVFAFLFYMSSLMFGMSIAGSVVEEKQSRIVEILAAAIPVRQLLTGKVTGNTVLAMGQLVLIVGVSLIGLTFTEYDVFLPGMAGAMAWYIPFFLAGFLALACIWAAAGAMASRMEDLQATTTPLTLVLVAIFVVGVNLDGVWQQVGSFVPVMSTILMPMRLLAGETAWWEPGVALLITLAFAACTVLAGSRLYRRSLLQTQGRVSLKAAWTSGD